MGEGGEERRLSGILANSRRSALAEFPDLIHPDYKESCTSNIQDTVLRAFGMGGKGRALARPGFSPTAVILLIIDALGYEFLKSEMPGFPAEPITSVFPSTTAAALTAINRGLSPREHGVPGWLANIPEAGGIWDCLHFSSYAGGDGRRKDKPPAVTPETLLLTKEPPLFSVLKKEGISPKILVKKDYIGGEFGRMMHGDMKPKGKIPYHSSSDFAVLIRRELERARKPLFLNAYWDGVDKISHQYGPHSEAARAELRKILHVLRDQLSRLKPQAAKDTLFVLTADHGQTQISPERTFFVSQDKFLRDTLVIPPCGDWRATYFYVREGMLGKTKRYLESHRILGKNFAVLESKEALKRGLFGPKAGARDKEFARRIGDLILIARRDWKIMASPDRGVPGVTRGTHGSLTGAEALVPFGFGTAKEAGLIWEKGSPGQIRTAVTGSKGPYA